MPIICNKSFFKCKRTNNSINIIISTIIFSYLFLPIPSNFHNKSIDAIVSYQQKGREPRKHRLCREVCCAILRIDFTIRGLLRFPKLFPKALLFFRIY